MKKRLISLTAVTALAMVMASNVNANEFSLRAGFGLTPDQFVVGGQMDAGKAFEVGRIYPSVDVGFGDNVLVLTFNVDWLADVSPETAKTKFFVGGGPTLMYYKFSSDYGDADGTEFGVTLVGGVRVPVNTMRNITIEGRVGLGDIPDFRALVGMAIGG